MTKTFKTLKIGDKIFFEQNAVFIHGLKYKNGYLAIQICAKKVGEFELKPWLGWHYIPQNHLHANKVKLCGKFWIHLTKSGYKKYMYNIIRKEIEK